MTGQKASAGFQPGVRLVGLEERTAGVYEAIRDQDYTVLRDGVGSQLFDHETLGIVSHACGKAFSAISFQEVETSTGYVPLFEVEVGGVTYDTRAMATGELSVCYLAWALGSAPPFSIILVEEPEAYLPPVRHAAIFGLLARYTLKLKLCLILTTHSPSIASEVPDRSLISIRQQSGLSQLPSGSEPKGKVLARLGLSPTRQAVLFVEDVLAKDVLSELLSLYELDTICYFEVIVCSDGESGITNRLTHAPKLARTRFLGVYDGDMKSKLKDLKIPHPAVFLPFDSPMEQEFLSAVEMSTKKFAQRVGRDVARLDDALTMVRGQDYHDRYVGVAQQLGIDGVSFASHALKHWVAVAGRKAPIGRFVRKLALSIDLALP